MVRSITEVHEDSLGMTNVQIAIWLGWETCPDLAIGRAQVLLTKFGSSLRVLSRLVQSTQESLFENGLSIG
jgi:hypothetical protein